MCSVALQESTFSPRNWRASLLDRLLVASVPLTGLALVTAFASGVSGRNRFILSTTVAVAFLWVSVLAVKTRWPYALRAGSLVATFVLTMVVTYVRVAFYGNASLVGGVAVIAAALFFGRRPMLVLVAALASVPVLTAAGMLRGVVPLPDPSTVSAASLAPWVRVAVIGTLLWTLIGLAVTYAVDHIEGALAQEREARRVLRDEQLKRVFLATISHELRTPLNGVLGMVDELSRTSLDDQQRRFVDVAGSSAKLLLSVINDMLDFSKMEAGKLELERTELLLADVIADVASMFARGAEEKGLALSWEAAPETRRMLIGDPSRLRQILANLLSNAVKFTHRGAIAVRATPERESARDVVVRVEVRDSGIGIDEAVQAKLFLPFSQVDASTTRQYGGTGLGLAICRGLVEQMGGRIGVTSQPGSGSTFWFTVPLGKSEVADAAPARKGHLLIVEDSDVNAEVAGGILRMAGHTFDRVADGLQAVEAVRRRHYDLVLMDCHLPELDGYGATRRIRELEASGELARGDSERRPVIALTASVAKEDLERATASGMDDYVSKPLEAGRLLAKIAAHMPHATPNDLPSKRPIAPEPRRSVADLHGALQRLQGNRDLLERVTKQLVDGAPAEQRRLREAVERRDLAAVRYAVHRLRGQAAAFDAAGLMASIDELMEAAAAERWPATGARLDAVERDLARLVAELSPS